MRYAITTNGQTYVRTREDNDSRLRIFNIGDYPVEVAINGGSYSEPFYRNQSFDISITKTPVTIRSIGGNSEVRTYRVYCSNVDECDIEGYFEPLTVESYESLIAKNAVLKSDIAQNLTNPNEVDVPSTKAVVTTLTEFMSDFGSPLRYKGSVKTYNDLPTSDRVVGDMYNVEEPSDDYVAGTNFAWTGEVWDALGGTLSVLPSAITKFNEVVTKAVQDFEELAVVRKTELTEIYERAVLAISGDGGLVDTAKETLQGYVDQGYEYEVSTQSNLTQVKTLASEVEDDKRQVAALEQSVRANAAEVRELKEDLGDISSAVKTATTAEANVRALESSAWLAANRTEEISDPENRIGNLQQTKSNRGEFWFKGGTLTCTNKWTTGVFSFATTFSMTEEDYTLNSASTTSDFQWLGTCVYSNTSDANAGFFLVIAGTRIQFFVNGQAHQYAQISDTKTKYADGKPHVLFAICDGTSLRFQIDDEVVTIAFSGVRNVPDRTPFKIFKNNSKLSRIKYFNFDMSDANAPYTIADYISGKDESPLLKLGVQSHNASDMVFSSVNQTTYPCDIVSDSTADTTTIATTGETASEYTWIDGRANSISIPQGANVEVSVGDLDVATSVQCYFYSGVTRVQTLSGVSNDNPTNSFVAPANLTRLSLIIHAGVNPIPTGTTLTITGLKIKVNGALLSLEDYTFNGKVFDTSGNNNTATITGAVYGTKDNAVEQMYQAFASRIQNITTE